MTKMAQICWLDTLQLYPSDLATSLGTSQ